MRGSTCAERTTTRRGERKRSAVRGQPRDLHSSSSGGRRSRFSTLRRRLLSARRRRAPAVAAVGNRTASSRSASRSSSSRRRRAIERLRHCERVSPTITVTTPAGARVPSLASSRRCTAAGSAVVLARSQDSSTRVEALLACWPPGPPLVSNRQRNSSPGTTRRSDTRIGAVNGSCTPKGYVLAASGTGDGARDAARVASPRAHHRSALAAR